MGTHFSSLISMPDALALRNWDTVRKLCTLGGSSFSESQTWLSSNYSDLSDCHDSHHVFVGGNRSGSVGSLVRASWNLGPDCLHFNLRDRNHPHPAIYRSQSRRRSYFWPVVGYLVDEFGSTRCCCSCLCLHENHWPPRDRATIIGSLASH